MRRSAGIPMGGDGLAVKPSAQPTLVRTQYLPPPAQMARELGISRPRGPSGLMSSCVIPGHQTPLHHAGYGHMADGIGAEAAVHRTARSGDFWVACCPWRGPYVIFGPR